MNSRISMTVLLAAVLASPITYAEMDPNVAEARGIVKQFFGTLKGELQAAMKAGGPVNAISVCNEKAPQIAKSVSDTSGWSVGRTTLKIRNTANVPLQWERAVLQEFEQRKANGEDVSKMEFSETVTVDGVKTFRYMKAIPTGDVCLKCHGGDSVKPEVEAKLKNLYPSDQARGYNKGDIRGAFTLKKKM